MSTRREFMASTVLAGAGLALSTRALALVEPVTSAYSVNIFSKNLQWLDYPGMAEVAAQIGFDGIDLTVRPNGHVEPARVEEDLPRAVAAVRNKGLQIPMITTAILSVDEPYTEKILKTAGALGIESYRMGWIRYDEKISIDENLKKFERDFRKLEALNKKYRIRGEYQNHSGAYLGSSIWDIAGILTKVSPVWFGLQYDVLHATVEGANSWPLGLKRAGSHVTSLPIKDFHWTKKDGKWMTEIVPLGEGMVDFKRYFELIKSMNIKGPFSMHFEYPLGGAENGTKTLTIDKAEVIKAMTMDLTKFREMLKVAGVR